MMFAYAAHFSSWAWKCQIVFWWMGSQAKAAEQGQKTPKGDKPQALDMIRADSEWDSRATETWVNKSNRANALCDVHRLKLRPEWEEGN